MEYTLVDVRARAATAGRPRPGFINGGMLAREESAAPGPVVVIDVPSIDDDAGARSSGLGGSTVVAEAAGRRDGLRRLRQGPRGQRRRPLGDRAARLTAVDLAVVGRPRLGGEGGRRTTA